jgi:ABC-2 type transport system permease protein
MFGRLKQMIVKEFLQVLRDPRMRMVVFGLPVVQMVVIAYALTTDVSHIRTAVLDRDGTPAARELVAAFTAAGYFEVVARPATPRELDALLDRGRVRAALHLPRGLSADVAAGRTARLQLIVDGTDSNTAAIVLSYAQQVMEGYNRRLLGSAAPLSLATRAQFNPNLDSRFYFVPGLIAVMLMVVSLLLTSLAIVREKEIGTIEQVMVTPIRRLEFIIGKTLPFLLMGYIIMTVMVLLAALLFGITVRGNPLLLYVMAGIYLLGNLGLALTISASAGTQQQALLTAFFILMPGVLLSGFIFPIHNMPPAVQVVTHLNPMRWFLEILHGIALKGLGVAGLWPAMAAQAGLAAVFLLLAALSFRKTLH